MIFVFARTHHAWVFVECKGNVSLERQAGAFEDDLGGEFGHVSIIFVWGWNGKIDPFVLIPILINF